MECADDRGDQMQRADHPAASLTMGWLYQFMLIMEFDRMTRNEQRHTARLPDVGVISSSQRTGRPTCPIKQSVYAYLWKVEKSPDQIRLPSVTTVSVSCALLTL